MNMGISFKFLLFSREMVYFECKSGGGMRGFDVRHIPRLVPLSQPVRSKHATHCLALLHYFAILAIHHDPRLKIFHNCIKMHIFLSSNCIKMRFFNQPETKKPCVAIGISGGLWRMEGLQQM